MLTNVFKTLFLNASNLNFYQDIVWFTSIKIIDILRYIHIYRDGRDVAVSFRKAGGGLGALVSAVGVTLPSFFLFLVLFLVMGLGVASFYFKRLNQRLTRTQERLQDELSQRVRAQKKLQVASEEVQQKKPGVGKKSDPDKKISGPDYHAGKNGLPGQSYCRNCPRNKEPLESCD